MTRKKCIKKLMALGKPRNVAEKQADLVKITGNYNDVYKCYRAIKNLSFKR